MTVVRQLSQHLRWFIAATLFAALALGPSAHFPVADDGTRDYLELVFVLPEGEPDDGEDPFGASAGFAALLGTPFSWPPNSSFSPSTALVMDAAWLYTFIIAPPRAPPSRRLN